MIRHFCCYYHFSSLEPQEQQGQNTICTHPGENATCTQEGVIVKPSTPTPTIRTCEQCFTTILSQAQITRFLTGTGFLSIPDFCITFGSRENSEYIQRNSNYSTDYRAYTG
jgi:hypothetical protein